MILEVFENQKSKIVVPCSEITFPNTQFKYYKADLIKNKDLKEKYNSPRISFFSKFQLRLNSYRSKL